MDVLRGEPRRRPPANTTVAAGLRAQLDDGVYDLVGADLRETPLVVRTAQLRRSDAPVSSVRATLCGVLVVHALRLLSVGHHSDDPFSDAVATWRATQSNSALAQQFDALDEDELARLTTQVRAHCATLRRSLGPIASTWHVRTSLFVSQRLAGGQVLLSDVVDLMMGTTTTPHASVALFDLTTSPLGEGAERALRFHALVQTLRTSTAPLRTAMFSSATGELWSLDVNDELLQRAVRDVLDVVAREVVTS